MLTNYVYGVITTQLVTNWMTVEIVTPPCKSVKFCSEHPEYHLVAHPTMRIEAATVSTNRVLTFMDFDGKERSLVIDIYPASVPHEWRTTHVPSQPPTDSNNP